MLSHGKVVVVWGTPCQGRWDAETNRSDADNENDLVFFSFN